MSLPVKIKLPDIFIEEMLYFQSLEQNPNRTTTGSASYTNPRTSATYNVASGGQQALALYLFTVNPKLEYYVFDIDTYTMLRSDLSTAKTDITNLETDIDIIRTAVLDTGTVNNIVIDTAGTFDLTRNGNILTIIPLFTNTSATVNISADAQTNKLIKKANDSGVMVALEFGDIKKNVPCQLVWDSANDFFIFAPKGGSNIKSIQRGTTTLATSGTTTTQNITSVKVSNSYIELEYYAQTNDNTTQRWLTSVDFNNIVSDQSSQLIFERGTNVEAMVINWCVVEYNSTIVVERGTATLTTVLLQTDVTVGSTDTVKNLLVTSEHSEFSSTDAQEYRISAYLTSSTNLRIIRKKLNTFGSLKIKWQLIKLK